MKLKVSEIELTWSGAMPETSKYELPNSLNHGGGQMVGSIGSVVTVIVTYLILAVISPMHVLAQQDKSLASVEGLLKSIGLAKAAMVRAPDFNLRDTNGKLASMSAHRGTMVLLNFWATWCGPCRDEMPSMENLSRSFGGQGLAVVAVNQRENAALVNGFMRTHGLNFTTPMDTDGRVAASYRVYGIPVTYLIDGNGQAIGIKSGPKDWASPEVIAAFRKLIGKDSSGGAMAGSIHIEPAAPLPTALRAKAGILVRGQQGAQSEAIGKLEGGDEMVPLGKVSGAGEHWYMVKTRGGVMGWVRGVEVEEISRQKMK
jgi:thiol-disulfide isomerase/thioredoxin